MYFQLNECTKPTAPLEEAQIEQAPAKNIGQTQNVLTNTILKAIAAQQTFESMR